MQPTPPQSPIQPGTGISPGSSRLVPGWWAALLLAVILLTGLGLRFWGLSDQGITQWDSGLYANVARAPVIMWNWLWEKDKLPPTTSDLKQAYEYARGLGVEASAQKAGHLVLLALAFLVVGVKDYAVLWVSAVCGFLTLLLAYWTTARFFSRRAALIATALLAASAIHVAYSRTGYPQTDTALFFLIGVFFYWKTLPRGVDPPPGPNTANLIWASLFLGICLTMHPSALTAVAGLWLTELWMLLAKSLKRPWSSFWRRSLLLLCLVPVPTLLVEAAAWAAHWAGGFAPETTLGYFFRGGETTLEAHTSFAWQNLWFFPNNLWYLEGPLVCALVALGLAACLLSQRRNLKIHHLSLITIVLFQLLIWSFAYTTLKAVVVILPTLAILASLGVEWVLGKLAPTNPSGSRVAITNMLLALLTAGLLFWGAERTLPAWEHKNGYQAATASLIKYMAKHGGVFALADQDYHIHPLVRFYVGQAKASLPDGFPGCIAMDLTTKGDYLFINEMWLTQDLNAAALVDFIKTQPPVIQVPHLQRPYYLAFKLHRSFLSTQVHRAQPPKVYRRYIYIYDLRRLEKRPNFAK